MAVIGAGSWGTALSNGLADNGHEVRLWSHNPEQVKEINESNTRIKNIYRKSYSLNTLLGYAFT